MAGQWEAKILITEIKNLITVISSYSKKLLKLELWRIEHNVLSFTVMEFFFFSFMDSLFSPSGVVLSRK